MELNEIYSGFKLVDIENLPDIKSLGYTFKHIKSGANLFYAENDDDNRVFFISFKTPPENDCGTAHIVEHSVLCGSKKYGVRDPFNELAKGSLNTYLNALTYADKTMYPVASRNLKDFDNLIDVYLDAVFNPNMINKKQIFMQEGWHYELKDKDSPIEYKGVVYNEMKGALSNPERILINCVNKTLFPTSIYKYESGGEPEAIPSLTYEKFIDFYKKYYTASNSFIYLYGSMDIKSKLKYLDSQYLLKYEYSNESIEILEEKNYSGLSNGKDTYSVTQDTNKEFFLYSVVVGKCTDPILSLSFDILTYILTDTNASPLKKALIERGICEDIEGWFDSSSYEMVFGVLAKNALPEKKEEFKNVILSTLKDISENGIDKELIQSSLNVFEFSLKEEDFGLRPKGLVYGMRAMKSWLHGLKPSLYLKHWEYFNFIKNSVSNNYFENLIKNYILKNNHSAFVEIKPEINKQLKIDNDTKVKLSNIKNSMSDDEIEQLINETKELEKFQTGEEDKELVEKIPFLNISDIDKKAYIIDNNIDENILFTPIETNGIAYITISFDTNKVPEELLPYVGLISDILGKVSTNKFSYEELPNKINMYTGGLGISCNTYTNENGEYKALLNIRCKALYKNIENIFKLIEEIIFNSDFENVENIKKILNETKIRLERKFINDGHMTALKRCMSYFSQEYKFKEIVSGIDYINFLYDTEKKFEISPQNIIENIKKTMTYIFTKENIFAAVGMESFKFDEFNSEFKRFYSLISNNKFENNNIKFNFNVKSEGILSDSKIVYNSKAFNFKKFGFNYSGKMQVAKTLINREYLWNKVRVQGGAYGSGCSFLRSGQVYFYSYRDPNIKFTKECFNNTGEFLNSLFLTEKEFKRYIIGTINFIDKPYTNLDKADISFTRYILGTKNEDVQKEKDDILSSSLSDIKEFSELFGKAENEPYFCTLGSNEKIEECKDIYDILFNMIKHSK